MRQQYQIYQLKYMLFRLMLPNLIGVFVFTIVFIFISYKFNIHLPIPPRLSRAHSAVLFILLFLVLLIVSIIIMSIIISPLRKGIARSVFYFGMNRYRDVLGVFANATDRYLSSSSVDAVDAAIREWDRIRGLNSRTNKPSNSHSVVLREAGRMFYIRYAAQGRLDDLNEAINLFERSLHSVYKQSPQPDIHFYLLSAALKDRFTQTNQIEYLDKSIEHLRLAINATSKDNVLINKFYHDPAVYLTDLPLYMSSLGESFLYRYSHFGSEADLDQAISIYTQIITRCPRDVPTIALSLNGLGRTLLSRYGLVGHIEDIDKSIVVFQEAVQITSQVHPDFPLYLNNLGGSLFTRYRRYGKLEDLQNAISSFQQAVRCSAKNNGNLPLYLTNLGEGLSYRYQRLGNFKDLDQAIAYHRSSIEQTSKNSVNLALYLINLGFALNLRYSHVDNMEDLSEAIAVWKQALDRTLPRSPNFFLCLSNLGKGLIDRFTRTREIRELDAAIEYFQIATSDKQKGSPSYALYLNNLGAALNLRYSNAHDVQDLDQAIIAWKNVIEIANPQLFPDFCHLTACNLGDLYYNQNRTAEARKVYEVAHSAIEYLRGDILLESAKRSTSKNNTVLYMRLITCCLHEQDIDAAFMYTEAGKGRAFVDMLSSARIDIKALEAENWTLAQELRAARELRRQIDTLHTQLSRGVSTVPTMAENSLMPSDERKDIVATIRKLQSQEIELWRDLTYKYPALTATQQAPTLMIADAMNLAKELSATLVEYYCHAEGWCAFVVTADSVHCVSLPLLTDSLLDHMLNWLTNIENRFYHNKLTLGKPLYDLYDAVIAPLRMYLPMAGRVVLAPFWRLHLLPFAAARDRTTDNYAADDYLLSFTPSLSALAAAYAERKKQATHKREIEHLLSVAYSGSQSSKSYLPTLVQATKSMTNRFAQVTSLYDTEATPNAIVANAPGHDVVHIACHGWYDSQLPEQSGLALAGGWLTVQRIVTELRLNQVLLVTLASCLGARTDTQRSGEVMGITHALMIAGAQAVVSALWSVEVNSTLALFDEFYQRVVEGKPPAMAMREAMQVIRAQPRWEHPFYWAAFQVNGLAYGS
jgi:tetratricopeptide (TPR) repeat protein